MVSVPSTPKGRGTSAKSRKEKQEKYEFIPPTEYVDVSRVACRFVQFLFACELFFHLHQTSHAMVEVEMFHLYQETFTGDSFTVSIVAPMALFLCVIIAFRTIHGVFAINFTIPSDVGRTIRRLLALITARVVFGGAVIAAGTLVKGFFGSEELHRSIEANLAHMIRYATKVSYYMEEINRLQQDFQCCGIKTDAQLDNGSYVEKDHPWNTWFDAYSLDDTYPNVIRELYSLPWSCCNRTSGRKCEHIGISRYLRRFLTPTDFNDVESALLVSELQWNPSDFEHYLVRNELAVATMYSRDCGVEAIKRVQEQADILWTRLLLSGLVVVGSSALLVMVIIHLQIIFRSVPRPTDPSQAGTPARGIGAGDRRNEIGDKMLK
ncbi:hypothetical protein Q1695_011844 [Nippostrongylus brasiliensis]|nr:hypothetical protein Q1695_011844 [Nippostrongylus brasiliensis]